MGSLWQTLLMEGGRSWCHSLCWVWYSTGETERTYALHDSLPTESGPVVHFPACAQSFPYSFSGLETQTEYRQGPSCSFPLASSYPWVLASCPLWLLLPLGSFPPLAPCLACVRTCGFVEHLNPCPSFSSSPVFPPLPWSGELGLCCLQLTPPPRTGVAGCSGRVGRSPSP